MLGTRKGTNQLGGGSRFLGILTTVQLPEWILEISFHIISCHLLVLFVVGTLWFVMCPHFRTLSPFSQCLFHFFVGLRVIGKLDSCFFTHHDLILSHAAWLTGSWSARTELLITDTPPPPSPPPSVSLSYTHTHKTSFLCGWGQVQSFFPLTAVISVCWQRLWRRLHKEASYSTTAFSQLSSLMRTCPTKTQGTDTQTHSLHKDLTVCACSCEHALMFPSSI